MTTSRTAAEKVRIALAVLSRNGEAESATAVALKTLLTELSASDDLCPLTLCVNRGVPDHTLHVI